MNEPIYTLRKDSISHVRREGDCMVIYVDGQTLIVHKRDIKLLIKRMQQCYEERFKKR